MSLIKLRVIKNLVYKPYMHIDMLKYKGEVITGYWEAGFFRQTSDTNWGWGWKKEDLQSIRGSYEERT